jgi:hypothetical protein
MSDGQFALFFVWLVPALIVVAFMLEGQNYGEDLPFKGNSMIGVILNITVPLIWPLYAISFLVVAFFSACLAFINLPLMPLKNIPDQKSILEQEFGEMVEKQLREESL